MTLDLASSVVVIVGALSGAVVTAFSGFAFSPVAGAFMVSVVPAKTLVPLLMICSTICQVATIVWMRRHVSVRAAGRMLAGGALGTPLGVALLSVIDALSFQIGFGLFLAAYATLMLTRPFGKQRPPPSRAVEWAVGLVGGLVGGLTAMPGAVPVLYCDSIKAGKEAQRAIVQPFILGMQVLALTLMAFGGQIDNQVIGLIFWVLPGLALGIVLGLTLFGRVADTGFRRIVLLLLLTTGLVLAGRASQSVARSGRADTGKSGGLQQVDGATAGVDMKGRP